jgi:hypothetical protein
MITLVNALALRLLLKNMEYPKPEATLEEQIAHWDVQRTLCIDGLVYATSQRIKCSQELNKPLPVTEALDYTSDPGYLDSFTG